MLYTSENPLFSLIIPTYNSSLTLKRCLDSILGQTFASFDVLLMDGGSTDDTLTIIKNYRQRDNRIKYWSEPDRGIYDAMNKGIAKAKGEWLYFIGSDDSLYNDAVLENVSRFTLAQSSGILYGNVHMRGHNQWNLNNVIYDGKYDTLKFLDRNICHQAIFYHRQVVEDNGFFSLQYITDADFDYNMRCYANTTFIYMDVIVADFFVGGQSTRVTDHYFHGHRGGLLFRYFGYRIFSKDFLRSRLYLQQAAFTLRSPLNLYERTICTLACLKLKLQSLFDV